MRAPSISRPLASGLAGLVAAGVLSHSLTAKLVAKPYDVAHVPSGRIARIAALGNRTFLSDLYWLSVVQYIGDPRADERGWEKLYPLADLVTDLDPRHGYAYQTAGIVLSAAGHIGESNSILEKGYSAGPPWWTFPYYIAFNYWFYLADYEEGARWARIAAQRPGASSNISHLALSLSSKGGGLEEVLTMLRDLRRSVQDDVSAGALDEQIKLATLERDAQELERAAARFEAEQKRAPATLDELVWNGYVAAIPPDPFGGHYEWMTPERRVRSTANSFRFALRQEPRTPRFQYQPPAGAETRP